MRIFLKVQEDQCWVLMQFKSKSVLKVQRLFGTLLLNNNKVQRLVGTTTTTVHLHRNLSNDEEGRGALPKRRRLQPSIVLANVRMHRIHRKHKRLQPSIVLANGTINGWQREDKCKHLLLYFGVGHRQKQYLLVQRQSNRSAVHGKGFQACANLVGPARKWQNIVVVFKLPFQTCANQQGF